MAFGLVVHPAGEGIDEQTGHEEEGEEPQVDSAAIEEEVGRELGHVNVVAQVVKRV